MNPKRPKGDFLVLMPLWLIMFVSSVQQVIVAPILPRVGEELSLGPDAEPMLGLVGTAFSFAFVFFALVAGAASDRFGRRRIILMGGTAMAGALILHGVAHSLPLFLGMRALAGAAAGMLTGAFAAYVGDYYPYERRGWALGWIISGFAAGWVLGIPAGTLLADRIGFEAPFVAFGWLMVLAVGLVFFFLPQPEVGLDEEALSVRRVGAKYAELIRRRKSGVIVLCYFLMYACVGLFLFFLPTWLEQEIGLTSTQVAMLFFVAGIALVAASPLAGRVSDRVGRKNVIVTAATCTCLLVGTVTLFVTGLVTALAFFTLSMVSESFRAAPMQALMSSLVGSEQRGAFFSLCNAVGQLGFGTGAAVAGLLYVRFDYVSNSLAGAVCIGLVALLLLVATTDPTRNGGT